MFRTIAVRCLAVLAGAAAITSLAQPAAFADNAYYSMLDVMPPSAGSIDSVDSNFNQIHCGPDAPGPCTISDQQTELGGRPTTGWYTYQLMASNGPAGYSWKWTSGCSGMTPTCTITNDQEYTTVAGEWVDTQFPQITTLRVPGWGRQPVEVSAVAADNGPIKFFVWTICHSGTTDCVNQFSDTGLTYLTGLADGQYDVQVYAVDTGLNGSPAVSSTITIDSAAPVLTVSSPRQNVTYDSFSPAVRFTAADPGLMDVRCNVDGGEQVDCVDGWRPGFLANGTHTISVQARDRAGNQVTISRRFTVADPQVTLVGTAESVYGQPARITVQVPKNTNAVVEFDDASTGQPLCTKTAPVTGQTTCSFAPKHFRPGVHDIFVRFTGDAYHSIAGATFQYTVDRIPTTMSAVAQSGRYGSGYPVQVSGLPAQATGDVEFRAGDTLLCTAHVHDSAAGCTVGTRKLEPGSYPITATYLGNELYLPVTRTFRLLVLKGTVTMTATNLPVGTYNTLATYAGDAHYLEDTARTVFYVGVNP